MGQQSQAVNLSKITHVIDDRKCIDGKGSKGDDTGTNSNPKNLRSVQRRAPFSKLVSAYSIRVPSWIFRRGIRVLVDRSHRTWGLTIRVYNQVPYDSEVFRLAKLGEWDYIQRLFEQKEASPWDVNPMGVTLLFSAAVQYDTDICAFLLDPGPVTPRAESDVVDAVQYLGFQIDSDTYKFCGEHHEAMGTLSLLLSGPDCVLEWEDEPLSEKCHRLMEFSHDSLSLLLNTIAPNYASLNKHLRAVLTCSALTSDARAVMLKLGPDLTLHQAFDELQEYPSPISELPGGSVFGNHLTLLCIASRALACQFALPHRDHAAMHRREAMIASIIEYESQNRSRIMYRSALQGFLQAYCMTVLNSRAPHGPRALDWNDYFTRVGRIWVATLQRLGADLLRYGAAEKAFFLRGGCLSTMHLELWQNQRQGPGQGFAFSLCHLVYGSDVHDWSLYVVPVTGDSIWPACTEYGMAGQFWNWIENPELFEMPRTLVEVDDDDYRCEAGLETIQGPTL